MPAAKKKSKSKKKTPQKKPAESEGDATHEEMILKSIKATAAMFVANVGKAIPDFIPRCEAHSAYL